MKKWIASCVPAIAASVLFNPIAFATVIVVGSGVNHAKLLLDFKDGASYTFDVGFGQSPGDTISGLELLGLVEQNTTLETSRLYEGTYIDGISFDGHSNAGWGGGEDWWHYWERDGESAPWILSDTGASQRTVEDGFADGWVYGRAGPPVPEPASLLLLLAGSIVLMHTRRRYPPSRASARKVTCCGIAAGTVLLLITASTWAADPWADQVVAHSPELDGSGLYNDPAAMLGPPTVTFYDNKVGEQFIASLAGGPFNLDAPAGNKVITTIPSDQYVIIKFNEPVEDDPRNPYGVDLLVFGNAFFQGSESVGPDTDMESYYLGIGVVIEEPVTVAVSSTGIGMPDTDPDEWFVYAEGPYADSCFPTNAYDWDRGAGDWGAAKDFTIPVDPALGLDDFAGLFAADAIDLYEWSGGGTGFDLGESGMRRIQYVYLSSEYSDAGEIAPLANAGEIDALADVYPALGDADRDGDVDLADVAEFQACFTGANGGPRPRSCFFADFDGDQDVDTDDQTFLTGYLTGPKRP